MKKYLSELVRQLDAIVDEANQDADWRRKHMTFEMLQMDAEKRGEARGAERMAKLTTILMQDGKTEDVLRICSDESFRKAKMKEYGI